MTHLATAALATQRTEGMVFQATPIRDRKLEACPEAAIILGIQKSADPAFPQSDFALLNVLVAIFLSRCNFLSVF